MDPAQPAFGFMLPMTTSLTLACTIAPAHIWHGSSVTYSVQPSSRQSPSFLLAFRIAFSSAWDSVFLSVFLRLYPRAITFPSYTITQPIGTSISFSAFFACVIAWRMKCSRSFRCAFSSGVSSFISSSIVHFLSSLRIFSILPAYREL